jgi:rhodanese-related sulfurtransferase
MIEQIQPHDLSHWLSKQGSAQAVVLDVREPWELATASIQAPQGFALVAIPMAQIPQRLSELSPEVPVACLCHHGARSLRVAAFLAQQGFEQVANLEGGIDAWSTQVDASVPRY